MMLLKIAAVLLLVSCAAAARNETKLVQEVCKAASELPYDDCVEALYKDERTETITDIRVLTFLSLDLALANSSEAAGYVDGLLENAPAAQKPVIHTCLYLKNSRGDFRAAIGDLMAGEPKYANYDCFITMDGVRYCRDAMKSANISIPGISTLDGVRYCRDAMKSANISIPGISTRCGWVEFFSHLCYTTTNMVHGKEQKH